MCISLMAMWVWKMAEDSDRENWGNEDHKIQLVKISNESEKPRMAIIREYKYIILLARLTLDLMHFSTPCHGSWFSSISCLFSIHVCLDQSCSWFIHPLVSQPFTFLTMLYAMQIINVKNRPSFTYPTIVTKLWYVHPDLKTVTLFNKITSLVIPNLDHRFSKLSSLIFNIIFALISICCALAKTFY